MDPYATMSDYREANSIITEDKEVVEYLELASYEINKATLTRIQKIGFRNLTANQQKLIKKATLAQADYIYENAIFEDEEVDSFSLKDISVSKKEATTTSAKLKISKKAFIYLKQTGLVNRIC